jgi:adenylylsulfate kinase-like enzyme
LEEKHEARCEKLTNGSSAVSSAGFWILEVEIFIFKHCHISSEGSLKNPIVLRLFKNAQMQGVQKTEPRSVYGNTLSGAVCSATQQMSVFEQPTKAP